MRLIDKDELYENLPDPADTFEADFFGKVLDSIDALPVVEAEPVRHGTWIPNKHTDTVICSECKRCFTEETRYCSCCGAKMGGGSNE